MKAKEIIKAIEKALSKKGVHSFFSPSGAYRWMNCPGSEHKQVDDITLEESSNEYSLEGTILHCIAELMLNAYIEGKDIDEREVYDLEGKKFATGGGLEIIEVTLSSEGLDKVIEYVDFCIRTHQDNPGSKMIIEGHTKELGLPTGSIDNAILSPTYLHLTDLKSGFVDVGPEDNMQLIAYGLSVYKEYQPDVKEVFLTIHQSGYAKTTSITVEELLKWEGKFARAQVSRFFRPGEWCYKGYCPYISSCGQYADWVCDGMEKYVMDERNWRDLIPQAKAAAKFGDAVNTELYKCLVNGGEVEGYEIGKRKRPLAWVEDPDLKLYLEARVGEGNVLKPESLKTPAQIKTVLKQLKKQGKVKQEVGVDDLTVDNGFSFTIKESKEGVEKKTANQMYFEDLVAKMTKEKK